MTNRTYWTPTPAQPVRRTFTVTDGLALPMLPFALNGDGNAIEPNGRDVFTAEQAARYSGQSVEQLTAAWDAAFPFLKAAA